MSLPHPITISATPEEIKDRFIRVAVDTCPDPKWHYRIAIPAATKMRPSVGRTAPTPQTPMESLGLFYREDIPVDLEVIGVLLGREIDPAHWLEMFLDFNGLSVASMKHLPLAGGLVGDAVCEWKVQGRPFAGRFVALKFGPRLYVVCCRAARDTYASIAEEFFISLTQFGAIDQTLGLCAEPVLKVGAPVPFPWQIYVPQSWQVTEDELGGGQAGFQAVMGPPSPEEAPVSSCLAPFPGAGAASPLKLPSAESYSGRLAVLVVPPSIGADLESAQEACLTTFRDAGLELESTDFEDEQPQGPLEASTLLVTGARLAGQEGAEVRCRVGLTHGLWFMAGVVGPARAVNPFAWMQNKRTLDVVTGSLQFAEPDKSTS